MALYSFLHFYEWQRYLVKKLFVFMSILHEKRNSPQYIYVFCTCSLTENQKHEIQNIIPVWLLPVITLQILLTRTTFSTFYEKLTAVKNINKHLIQLIYLRSEKKSERKTTAGIIMNTIWYITVIAGSCIPRKVEWHVHVQ